MTRKTAVLAIVALMVAGTSAALAAGAGPAATSDAPLAQGTETTTTANDTAGSERTTVAPNETAAAETTVAEGQVGPESARVTFLNQTAGFTFDEGEPNQTTVLIERVVVPEGGFVVIHRAQNATGEYATEGQVSVGPVVGNSTYLQPGVHSNVAVELNASIDESQTLVAMPHRDTNDDQQYDFPQADGPYTENGSPVIDTGYVIIEYDAIEANLGESTQTEDGETAGNETTEAANGTTAAANATTTTEA